VGPIAAPGQYHREDDRGRTELYPAFDGAAHAPTATPTIAHCKSSVRLQLKVREDITAVSNMTNQLEWMRRQLEDQSKAVASKQNLLQMIGRHK